MVRIMLPAPKNSGTIRGILVHPGYPDSNTSILPGVSQKKGGGDFAMDSSKI
jgi:hypothetical protein